MDYTFRDEVKKKDYRPTPLAEKIEDALKKLLGLKARYEAARLCIGRSLAEVSPLSAVPPAPTGKPIPGEFLFGEDLDFWIAVLMTDAEMGPGTTPEALRLHLEAHWHRGAQLLEQEIEESNRDETLLLLRLAELLPSSGNASMPGIRSDVPINALRLSIGELSLLHDVHPLKRIEFILNGPGDSPNIALMGRAGTGKTTTGVQMALQILRQAQIPLLFIDPKGEFVRDGALQGPLADAGMDIRAIEVGPQAIPLDFLPGPDTGSSSVIRASMQFRDSIAACCRGAGDIQQDLLRQAAEAVIRKNSRRDLESIKQEYEEALRKADKKHDSIVSRLNELIALHTFAPTYGASEFFSHSWVISLRSLGSEELKRAVILLLIDALRSHILSQPDSQVDTGYRQLRHLLVIDEARRILAEKKYESLVDLVRQGRSKGQVTMLLSQDPSDFDGQSEDFTKQLSTVIAFACSQTDKGLRSLSAAYGRRLQAHEFSDLYLPKGVSFVKLPQREPERILCWGASPEEDDAILRS